MNARLNIALVTAAALFALSSLSACGNGGASEPPVTSYDPGSTSKMQFAVGVATIASNGGQSIAYGLNVVETLRQADGLSGVLYSQPQIIGPSKFDVLISTQTGNQVQAAGGDLGTNHVTWGTLNQSLWTGPPRGQKQSSTGAFGYGLCPCNSDSGPPNGVTPLFQAFNLPVYGNNEERFYGGPPAFPAAGPSVVALGWEGYSLGFTDFAVQPVLGAYHFYAAVPPAYTTPNDPTPSPNPDGTPTPAPGVLAATAQLTSLSPLPVFVTPSFVPDRKGGGTITVSVPKGATEAMAMVRALGGSGTQPCSTNHASDAFYTIVAHRPGTHALALPDEIGPLTGSGKPTATICPKGTYQIYAVGADYPAYEASYPNNLSQLPHIRGVGGQADVTTSDILNGQYP